MIHLDFENKRRRVGGIGACGAFADVVYPVAMFRECLVPHVNFRNPSKDDCPGYICKRCLASLAKRDREFQRKARRWFDSKPALRIRRKAAQRRLGQPHLYPPAPVDLAARAIAREESASVAALKAQSDSWTFDVQDGWLFYGESGLIAHHPREKKTGAVTDVSIILERVRNSKSNSP